MIMHHLTGFNIMYWLLLSLLELGISNQCYKDYNLPADSKTTSYILSLCILMLHLICECQLLFLLNFQTRQAFTAEQINEATYVDIHGNKAVFDSLRNNPKVSYDGRRFSYKVN